MISVIIPALNEAKTIRQVIQHVKRTPQVSEIIVVDDQSMDDTVSHALDEGVRVITSPQRGKGGSMREGLMIANNDIIIYIDADIANYPADMLLRLASPIMDDEADFVKSYFDRQAGRVTELVAKPLLSILFPDMSHYKQPLSGMIAGKKSLFEKVTFENDYGVDIGILIDMHRNGARVAEVNIGVIENDMQPLMALSKMSREVAKTIFKRAQVNANLETLENINVIQGQMEYALREAAKELKKMVIFDMDNTVLTKSFIHTAAEQFGFKKELVTIITENNNDFIRTKKIAKLLEGKSFGDLIKVVESIPIVEDAAEVIKELKSKGYVCGIISDSYDCITNHVKNMLGMDFSLANVLEFSDSVATGEVKIPSQFLKNDVSFCGHDYCKSNMMNHILLQYDIDARNSIVIGDGENDICMIKQAGIGIAYNASSSLVNMVADVIVDQRSFAPLLEIA
ncbi:phosphoserine phosphatase SerB [Chitinophaga skermanii]|uniref:Phosphoserine phosphatase SerB n=1 Tax=Chitinophaga skermanii TaxID=331697 RepID=A0A327QKL0_9BACT|nr:HAD-IB family phosphatase [Chitinophaga skermanii]RAJ05069.1 phosphoserine phosphatase SerB [Chitinophaga skermanii]